MDFSGSIFFLVAEIISFYRKISPLSIIPLCIVIPTNIAIIVKLVVYKNYRQNLFVNSDNTAETAKITLKLLSVTVT